MAGLPEQASLGQPPTKTASPTALKGIGPLWGEMRQALLLPPVPGTASSSKPSRFRFGFSLLPPGLQASSRRSRSRLQGTATRSMG